MKSKLVGLQASVSTTYDKTKTSTLGRARQKTLNGKQVIGPSLSKFIDVQTLASMAPSYTYFAPMQNQLFVAQSSSSQIIQVALFNFDRITGSSSYVGKVILNLANSASTTHTQRGFAVTTDGTNIRIFISTTGSVAINSGVSVAYCNVSQFTNSGINLFPASGPGQSAIYLLQSSDYYGVQAATGYSSSQWGIDIPYLAASGAVNTKLYAMANTAAAPNAMIWEMATTPDVDGQIINGISSNTTAYTNTSPSAYFRSATLPGYSGTSGEPICLQTGSAAVPTPFNAWSSGTLQTTSNVYFTRDAQRFFTFTCTALTTGISANSTYTVVVGAQTLIFTVVTAVGAGATSFVGTLALPAIPSNPSIPPTSGTLTRTTGTGDASITFSANVAGNFHFNLSPTSGAAATLPAQTLAGFTMLRAFGTSTNQFLARTPIAGMLPALTGTILQSNVINYARPISVPQNATLNNQDCLSVLTSSNLYLGRLSDLIVLSTTGNTTFGLTSVTSMGSTAGLAAGMSVIGPAIPAGVTILSVGAGSITLSAAANSTTTASSLIFGTNNWTSLTVSNLVGTGIDVVSSSAQFGRYGGVGSGECIDQFMAVTSSTFSVLIKPLQNNFLTASFGGTDNQWYETLNSATIFGGYLNSISGLEFKAGWMFLSGGSTGQRGVIAVDVLSEANFGISALISPIKQELPGTILESIMTLEELHDVTGNLNFWIRSATTSTDAIFDSSIIPTVSAPAGWTRINTSQDLTSISIGPFYQMCITYQVISLDTQTPAQVNDIVFAYLPPGESSDNWVADIDNSTQGTSSPSYASFYLASAYSSSVPALFARVVDSSGSTVFSANTSANPTAFQYSVNGGTTWLPLGIIPNTVGTRIRVLVTPVPSAEAFISLRES
jgi:hypothetical protein